MVLSLPGRDGRLHFHRLSGRTPPPAPTGPARSRVAFAAAHVVADALADTEPGGPARLDWDATMAIRHQLWALGLGVAEAMDTAQRGMGLDVAAARELIARSAREAAACGGRIAAGAGTDQLPFPPGPAPDGPAALAAVAAAYAEQCAFVEAQGAQVILMASRALCAAARGSEDYAAVYGRVLGQLRRPAILHWLGEAFDPALAGYWGAADLDAAAEHCLAVVRANAARIDGLKVSLLDARREEALRAALPAGVRLYTGDDFHYPELIAGDGLRHSDALLGIFDAIAPVAAAALHALDRGDRAACTELLAPTVPLSRHIFAAPTHRYKTGLVFLAYVSGRQPHFRMLGGQESARSLPHLAECLRLADAAGLLPDPELTAARMRLLLALAGVD
jgi:hypothetical protein